MTPSEKTKQATVHVRVGAETVHVPVSDALLSRFLEQFVHGKRTEVRAMRFRTVVQLLEAAYRKGWVDAQAVIVRR